MNTPDPRPALEEAIVEFGRASALLDAIRLRFWDAEGLTVTQLRLLSWVSEEEGLSNADLADRLYVTRPSVSALLDRLERGGFLRRDISPNDRRGISIWLEERGRRVVTTLAQEGHDYVARLLEGLADAELREITGALARLVEAGAAARARDLQADRNQS